jgi:hypothetical protein
MQGRSLPDVIIVSAAKKKKTPDYFLQDAAAAFREKACPHSQQLSSYPNLFKQRRYRRNRWIKDAILFEGMHTPIVIISR